MLPLALVHASPVWQKPQSPVLCRQRWALVPWPGEDKDPSLGAAQTQAEGSSGCQGLPRAWAGMGDVSLAQCGISHELSPRSRQGWMPGPCASPGSPNQACPGAKSCAVSS